MKLLILTQSVNRNDPVLGFFHGWISEFAKHCEQVTVIALSVGEYELPSNVKVLALGKESGASRLKYLYHFYRYIWRERKNYDAVFVHMNPEYVVLGGPLWRIWGKKIGLWYTHKQVDLKLRIAEKLVHDIFTASRESFRLKSGKTHVMGHGIDVEFWGDINPTSEEWPFTILQIGRITPIKHCEVLINAASLLSKKTDRGFRVIFIGEPALPSDREYLNDMKRLIDQLELGETISFAGALSATGVREYFARTDVTINMLPTGGMDKAVLESLAAGIPAITTNQAFVLLYGTYAQRFVLPELHEGSASELSEALLEIMKIPVGGETSSALREHLRREASHTSLVKNIIMKLK